jgi:hypothetical protein
MSLSLPLENIVWGSEEVNMEKFKMTFYAKFVFAKEKGG